LTTLPIGGVTDQFTLALVVPLNEALRVAFCPALKEAVAGETLIETGTSEIVAVSLLVESATLVAFTVMVSADAIFAGAV
jgi:hypothetical protein